MTRFLIPIRSGIRVPIIGSTELPAIEQAFTPAPEAVDLAANDPALPAEAEPTREATTEAPDATSVECAPDSCSTRNVVTFGTRPGTSPAVIEPFTATGRPRNRMSVPAVDKEAVRSRAGDLLYQYFLGSVIFPSTAEAATVAGLQR